MGSDQGIHRTCPTSCLLKTLILFPVMWWGNMGEHVYKRVQSMRQSEITLQELLLSFHHVDLEELTQVIGLTTSTFTH